jgi:hypothetical protein
LQLSLEEVPFLSLRMQYELYRGLCRTGFPVSFWVISKEYVVSDWIVPNYLKPRNSNDTA